MDIELLTNLVLKATKIQGKEFPLSTVAAGFSLRFAPRRLKPVATFVHILRTKLRKMSSHQITISAVISF
jgi:hypothetical protein